ncbi:MAG TPA: HAD-IA family hydrolase [Opitutaceae bacterium]|nr:HAD-IA family hydrolase [Opitutaceae bacterium]
MIRALIFDFDGLILDTEKPLIDAYAAIHAKHGVPFDRSAFIRSVGHADYAFDPWHGFSPHADRAQLELERRAVKNELILREKILPGVVALLDAARARQLRVGLASNSQHEWVEPHLARLGLRDRFEFLACREDAPSPKPEPDLYKLVLQRFGLRGHEAIAFEDSHTGCLAAKRAHLHAVACPNTSTAHHDFSVADLRVASLAEIELDALLARFEGARRRS